MNVEIMRKIKTNKIFGKEIAIVKNKRDLRAIYET